MLVKSLENIYENYDTFFIDMYGVLYDGSGFFQGVLELMKKIRNSGRRIIILSNTTMVSEPCKEKYLKKGLVEKEHYDLFISSGEAFKQTLQNYISNAKTYFQAFHPNNELFKESGLTEVNNIEEADFIYIGYLNAGEKIYIANDLKDKSGNIIPLESLTSMDCHDIQDFGEISSLLDNCLKLQKTLVVVNPDLFALELISTNEFSGKRPVLCQGAIGEFYERMGGNVIYFGKPYSAIYDFAKKFVSKNEKVCMIGDTPWTDILGGNIAEIDTILTLTGVSGEFLKNFDQNLNIDNKINLLLQDISTKMTHKNLLNYPKTPTHIIESFADINNN